MQTDNHISRRGKSFYMISVFKRIESNFFLFRISKRNLTEVLIGGRARVSMRGRFTIASWMFYISMI